MSEIPSSTEHERILALEARVNSLERQLKRQKIARKNAESFLETYSQDAYLANQALRKAASSTAIGQTAAFREIDIPHAKVHSSGIAAVQAKQNGNNAEADAKLMEMEQASERFMTLLDRLIN